MLRAGLEQAGMVDLATGKLGRRTVFPLSLFHLLAARPGWATVRGRWLCYDALGDQVAGSPAAWNGALDAFLALRTPADIEQFVLRYGPLGLCRHGLPSSHPPGCPPRVFHVAQGHVFSFR